MYLHLLGPKKTNRLRKELGQKTINKIKNIPAKDAMNAFKE